MNAAVETMGKHPPLKVMEPISFLRTIPRASATWKPCLLLQKRWISLMRTAFICGDADATGAYDNTAFNVALYQQREQARTDFVTIPDGGHGYGTFTKEQKRTTVECILSWMAQ